MRPVFQPLLIAASLAMAGVAHAGPFEETAQERVYNEYQLCMQTGSFDQKYCWQSAYADVYVDLCVAQGNGRWFNWGIHAECVEKVQKLLGNCAAGCAAGDF